MKSEKQHRKLNKNDAPKNILEKETKMGEDDFIVSKTDTRGFIAYFNKTFLDICGYSKDELRGANHNLIRHPDMPRIAFKLAWDLIQSGQEFFGFVKNLRKDGGYYWVFAYITADYDTNGNIIGYTSFRRKPKQSAIDAIAPVYKLLLDEENRSGVASANALLEKFLKEHNTSYNDLVMSLQGDV